MKAVAILAIVLLMLPGGTASGAAEERSTDLACPACHGVNGVSVADHIPNLAGQRQRYLAAQLHAFKEGTRKSEVMNVIATQLDKAEITRLAAHYAAMEAVRSDAPGGGKSAYLADLAEAVFAFPAAYRTEFSQYHELSNPASRQIQRFYANRPATSAAAAGKALPDGSVVMVEFLSMKLDGDQRPLRAKDGSYVADAPVSYTVMARGKGWGDAVPPLIRNQDWRYASFDKAGVRRQGANQAECLACHKAKGDSSFVFTLKHLAEASE